MVCWYTARSGISAGPPPRSWEPPQAGRGTRFFAPTVWPDPRARTAALPQGMGKSSFWRMLGMKWYMDSLYTFDGKDKLEPFPGHVAADHGTVSKIVMVYQSPQLRVIFQDCLDILYRCQGPSCFRMGCQPGHPGKILRPGVHRGCKALYGFLIPLLVQQLCHRLQCGRKTAHGWWGLSAAATALRRPWSCSCPEFTIPARMGVIPMWKAPLWGRRVHPGGQ